MNFKICTRIKPKVSVPWHENLVNEAMASLTKDVSNNFTKIFIKRYDKNVSDH